MTQKELLESVLIELTFIKSGMPNGEVKQMQKDLENMKEDMSELKRTLLNPDNGVIVNTNKNTDFRHAIQAGEKEYHNRVLEFEQLKRWQSSVTKALWIAFSAIIAIILKLLSELK